MGPLNVRATQPKVGKKFAVAKGAKRKGKGTRLGHISLGEREGRRCNVVGGVGMVP